jgi:hypothetical protein
MKKLKLFAVSMLLSAFVCLAATSSYAQAPQIVAVGSSGALVSTVTSMVLGDATQGFSGPICGSNVWTLSKASLIFAVDPRSGGIPNEPGTLAVVWDSNTSPTTVCIYLSVDSLVGQRLFFAQSGAGGTAGNGFLHVDPSVSGTSGGTAGIAGANKVGFIQDTVNNTCGPASNQPCGLPPAVFALVNGAHFNVAYTDIRPDDALSEYFRTTCSPANSITCFGYGPLGGIGTAILSSFNSGDVANPIGYAISGGTDPFPPNLAVPNSKIINIGAYPIMFFYNTGDVAAGGLGALLPQNVLSHSINAFLGGVAGFNQDIMGVATSPLKAVDIVQREPLSGTYTVTDFQIVHQRDGDTDFAQEHGFTPTSLGTGCFVVPSTPSVTYADPGVNCSNPMRVPGNGNHRFRSIGTGELVAAVSCLDSAQTVPPPAANCFNRLGYAFYSLGTFASSKASTTHYMTLDGVEPLFPTHPTAAYNFPTCSGFFNALPAFSCTANPTFDGLKSGNYRVWNIIRAVRYANCVGGPAPTCYTPPASGPSVDAMVTAAQDQAHSAAAADFVPYQFCTAGGGGTCTTFASGLNIFRSHIGFPGITVGLAHNGNSACGVETGGDVYGVIFPVVSDITYCNLTGNEFLTWVQ